MDRTGLEGKRQDWTVGLPVLNGQHWNAIERTEMKDFLFEQDKMEG